MITDQHRDKDVIPPWSGRPDIGSHGIPACWDPIFEQLIGSLGSLGSGDPMGSLAAWDPVIKMMGGGGMPGPERRG